MAKCNGCGKYISTVSTGVACCGMCSSAYHKGCVSLPDTAPVARDWGCPECKKKMRKGDNTLTPVRSISGDFAQSSAPTDIIASSLRLDAGPSDAGVRDLRSELAECVTEIRELRREMTEFCTSVAGIVDRMDGFEKRLEVIEQRKDGPRSEKIVDLEREVNQLKLELNDRDQEALLSDLEIGHLPEEKGENVVHAVTVLATRLGVRLEEQDILYAERVGVVSNAVEIASSTGATGEVVVPRARRVVVRLARRRLRDELLQAARVRRTLTATDTGRATAGAASARIFLNERLTRTNRQLFHRVREMCRKLQWRFSWTRRGRIYARQAEGKTAFYIRSESDLARVFELDLVRS